MSQETTEGTIAAIKIIERLVKVSGLFRKVHDSSESAFHTIIYQGYIANQPQQRKVKFIYDERIDPFTHIPTNFAQVEFSHGTDETLKRDMKVDINKYQSEEMREVIRGVTEK
jgi:hypothetical protein